MEEQKSIGPALGIIIIIIIIVVGGVYFWVSDDIDEDSVLENAPEGFQSDIEALQTQGDGDEIADIEADLDATNLDQVDADLADLDQELTDLTAELDGILEE